MKHLNKFKYFINESDASDAIDFFINRFDIEYSREDYINKVNFISDVLDVFQSTIDEYDFYISFEGNVINKSYRISTMINSWINEDSVNDNFYLNFYFDHHCKMTTRGHSVEFKKILKSLEDDSDRLERMGYKFDKANNFDSTIRWVDQNLYNRGIYQWALKIYFSN